MFAYSYDGSFCGFLSVVFDCYQSKRDPLSISTYQEFSCPLFAEEVRIEADETHAQRVWNGLKSKSEQSAERVYRIFLSEDKSVPLLLYQYIKLVFSSNQQIDSNFANPTILSIDKWFRSITREAQRALMFIRFQKLADGTWFAAYEPQYNILPLVTEHFQNRFADQKWIIYDTARKFGYYYDLQTVNEVTFALETGLQASQLPSSMLDADELLYQALWQDYYQATNIAERRNTKVHVQFLPKRFWKNLTEKRKR